MKIYKVTMTHYDYWKYEDHDGWSNKEKYFASLKKANQWIENNQNYFVGYSEEIQIEEWQKPEFKIEEIEVE